MFFWHSFASHNLVRDPFNCEVIWCQKVKRKGKQDIKHKQNMLFLLICFDSECFCTREELCLKIGFDIFNVITIQVAAKSNCEKSVKRHAHALNIYLGRSAEK